MRGLNIDDRFIYGNTNRALKEYLKLFGIDEREVYYAENLNTKSDRELKALLSDLVSLLRAKTSEDMKGLVEFHPTSDRTMKSAHIHYWGADVKSITPIIEEFIATNLLTNRLSKASTHSLSYQENSLDIMVKYKSTLKTLEYELESIDEFLKVKR
jgi:hypothetical protein